MAAVQTKPITTQQEAYDPWAQEDQRATLARQQIAQLQQQANQIRQQMLALPNPTNGGWEDPAKGQRQVLQKQLDDLNNQIDISNKRAEGTNPDGSAIAPEWRSLIDPATGKLRSIYQLELQGLDPTQWEGYSRMREEALRAPGTQSAWAQLQVQKQAAEEANARDAAARQASSGQSAALAQLAMRGGFGSGARTRVASQMAKDLLGQRQAVARQGIMSRLGIATEDEQARQRGLENLSRSEMDIGKVNKEIEGKVSGYNLQNLMKEIEGRRAWEQEQYKEKMRAWASEKQAQATESSGGGK